MQGRDGKVHNNPPCAPNDGTLNAIVNNSVRSLDVPLHNKTSADDEMLSWLHYPVEDPLDRGYCSDMFGDLPNSSAPVLRHSFNQNAPFSTSTSIFSGMLSHRNRGVSSMVDTRTALSESTRDAAESCGSGPAEASCRVAGADAVVALSENRAADLAISHMEMEVLSKLDSEGEVLSKMGSMAQPTCNSVSSNAMFYMQSGMSQTLSQGSSQQQASFTGHVHAPYPVLKPLDLVNRYMPPVPMGKQTATNFALFSRPAEESKANLHMVGESSGPTNVERVRQQVGQHGMFQELGVTHAAENADVEAAQVRWSLPPGPPLLPLPTHCRSSVELEKSAGAHGRWPPPLPPPPSSVSESRDGTNLSKDTMTDSRMSIMSSEKALGTADQTATSPSRCSASSTERSGKITDSSIKNKKPDVGEASDYQSEDASEMANVKKSPSNSKRMRTAEMHNQSERKRRVKINDKLRALQELIPNGNKPDKASLLDAVIEYVKLLQSQLQVMSMRTGIGIPSWMIPNVNLQHLQMPALPQMRLGTDGVGVGMGMRMGMGMGMMDANAAAVRAGCTVIPMPMYPGQPPTEHSSALQPADHSQPCGIVNAHNFYGSSQVQHPPMNLSMNQTIPMYNAYIPQPQLQVHPQPQPQQQQFQVQTQQSRPNSGKKPVH